jgi:hypothetical protein
VVTPLINVPGSFRQPMPHAGTRFRIVGPIEVNGMSIWRVYTVNHMGKSLDRVGPDFFLYDDALKLVDDLRKGKKTFFLGSTRFVRKKL